MVMHQMYCASVANLKVLEALRQTVSAAPCTFGTCFIRNEVVTAHLESDSVFGCIQLLHHQRSVQLEPVLFGMRLLLPN